MVITRKVLLPVAVVVWLVWGLPAATLRALQARRRLRTGSPRVLELQV